MHAIRKRLFEVVGTFRLAMYCLWFRPDKGARRWLGRASPRKRRLPC